MINSKLHKHYTSQCKFRNIKGIYQHFKDIGTSENYQNQNLKQISGFARFLGERTFYDIKTRQEIVSFLNTKIKDSIVDPAAVITTMNVPITSEKNFF